MSSGLWVEGLLFAQPWDAYSAYKADNKAYNDSAHDHFTANWTAHQWCFLKPMTLNKLGQMTC